MLQWTLGVHVSFSTLVSSGYMPRSEIAGSCGGFILSFLRISIPSSIVTVPIHSPANSYAPHFYPFLCHIHLLSLSFSDPVTSDSLWPHGLQHVRPPCPSPSPGVCQSSCPLHQWCYQNILPLSHSSPSAFSLSQHQGLFQWAGCSHQVTKVLELRHQSFWRVFRVDLRLVWSPGCPRDSQKSSPAPQFENINWSALWLLYHPVLTTICDYWKKHSLDYMLLCWQSDVFAF